MTKAQALQILAEVQHGEAEAFFYAHAGYSWLKDVETQEEGRKKCAKALAEAEEYGQTIGLEFSWEDDWSVGNHKEFFGDDSAYADREPETCETCLAILNGDVVASLGCIDDADDNYRRVVQAQLADEFWEEMKTKQAKEAAEMAQTKDEQGYNGWTNYETWCMALWIDNDQGTYEESRRLARLALEVDTDSQANELAGILKDWQDQQRPEEINGPASVWTDLLTAAFGEINWYEIAENHLEEVRSEQ